MTDELQQGREPSGPPGPFAPGGRHRRTLVMAGIVLAFLVVVAVVGLFRGKPDPPPRPTPSPTASSSSDSGPPLALTSPRCATLDADGLVVGFGVANHGSKALTITELIPTFPIGGLTPLPSAVPDPGACPAVPTPVPATLGPGDEAFLAFVLKPTDPQCIAPLVVQVGVQYSVVDSGDGSVDLSPFPDLGDRGLPGDCSSPGG